MSDSVRSGGAHTHDEAGLRMRMRSEERRITSQHEKLDALCRDVFTRIDKDGPEPAMSDFNIFGAALDAHMTVEEDIYFPALHGLRPDAGDELTRLVAEHERLRRMLDRVQRALERGEKETSKHYLEELARQVSVHESEEEDLIVRINEGPLLEDGHHRI